MDVPWECKISTKSFVRNVSCKRKATSTETQCCDSESLARNVLG